MVRFVGRLVSALALPALVLAGSMTSVGCTGSGKPSSTNLRAGIPPQAELVTSSQGGVAFKAPEAGRMYAYDATRNRSVGRFHLRKDQQFVLDARSGRATIDGNEVKLTNDVRSGSLYQVYFEPDPTGAGTADSTATGGTTGGETTVTTERRIYEEVTPKK